MQPDENGEAVGMQPDENEAVGMEIDQIFEIPDENGGKM